MNSEMNEQKLALQKEKRTRAGKIGGEAYRRAVYGSKFLTFTVRGRTRVVNLGEYLDGIARKPKPKKP